MNRPWENENLSMDEAEKIIVMKKYRAALLKEARGILAEAQLEKRDLTTAEEKRYNALDKEIDEVGLLHDVAEAKLAEERKAGEEGAPLASGRPYPQAGGNSALDDRGRVIPLLTHEQRMSDHVKEQAPEELRAGEATTDYSGYADRLAGPGRRAPGPGGIRGSEGWLPPAVTLERAFHRSGPLKDGPIAGRCSDGSG